MTTLATMIDRIAREIRRSNINTQIEEAILTAIDHYQGERFWFNVSREMTFDSVVDQEFYTSTDDADIGLIEKIDYVKLELDDDQVVRLWEVTPDRVEELSEQGTQTGEPRYYTFYDKRFRLYPVPDDVYTVRVGGVIKVAAPATSGETGNPWMVEAEKLIRMRAQFELFAHVIVDTERAQIASGAADEILTRLKIRTSNKVQTGGWSVTPTDF